MKNVSAVEKMAELMQEMEESSPRVAALQYCLKQVAEEAEKRNAELEARCAALAAENAVKQEFIKTCFRAAADGASMDGADIQEIGERLGLFGRETYQPVLHGYICGHEAGEDTVYVMKKTPATDAFLVEVRAQARNEGINYAGSRIAAAFNHGFVDKPLTEVCDVVRMILDTKEELANSTQPAADGLSGEYAEKFLEDSAAQLREGGAEKQSILSDEDCHAFVKAFTKGAAK